MLIGLGLSAVFLSLVMTAVWAIVAKGAKSGFIDATWSFAVGITGIALALWPLDGAVGFRQGLVAAMAGLWSLRLGGHILARTLSGGDDPRYAALKDQWGEGWRGELWRFLQIQAFAAWLLGLAIFAASHNPAPELRWLDGLGAGILVAAIFGEGVADAQLARFRRDPSRAGGICDEGLWGLSRHPNYFFQWLGWTGYALIAFDPGGAYPWGLVALVGPVFMYWVLVHASGIPPLEAHMLRSRGQAWRDYQARVRAFWPFPKA